MKQRKFDWILIIIWPIIASVISMFWQVNFFVSTILFYVLPSIYISLRNPKYVKKALYMALIGLPILLITDWIAVKTGTWFFPTSIFDSRLFGTTVFEVVLWLFMYVYFVMVFYEYFLDRHFDNKPIHRRFKYMIFVVMLFFVIFLMSMFVTGTFVKIPYIYLIFGFIFCFIPIPLILFKFPKLITKVLQATIYFAASSFLWEIVALKLNQWTFPGNYFIGWLEIANVKFPLEEFLVWIVLGSAAVIVWYEYFDDDCK